MKSSGRPHNLEKAIPFLLARTGARMGNAFSKALKPFDLDLSEWRVCASLRIAPGQTLSELAPHAATKLSALCRVVDRLEARQLVVRLPSDTDGRSVRMRLTPAGLKLTDSIIPLAQHYEAVAISGLTRAEVSALRIMLQRIFRNAESLEVGGHRPSSGSLNAADSPTKKRTA